MTARALGCALGMALGAPLVARCLARPRPVGCCDVARRAAAGRRAAPAATSATPAGGSSGPGSRRPSGSGSRRPSGPGSRRPSGPGSRRPSGPGRPLRSERSRWSRGVYHPTQLTRASKIPTYREASDRMDQRCACARAASSISGARSPVPAAASDKPRLRAPARATLSPGGTNKA